MNALSIQTQQTMLSIEIAELTGKQHKNVMRDIDVIIEQLTSSNLSWSIKSTEYKAGNGQMQPCYELDHDATIVVVTGYDAAARMKVVKRLRELEQQALKPIDPMQVLNDPAAMRSLLLTYAETVIEKDKVIAEKDEVIAEQTPKVAALVRLSESMGSLCLTDAAKTLKIPRHKLITYLSTERYIYKRGGVGNWIAYQNRIESGLLEHRPVSIRHNDGTETNKSQVLITSKGLAKLAEIFSSGATIGGLSHA